MNLMVLTMFQALVQLLPQLPLNWIEFDVGQMGVFVIERSDLVEHAAAIRAAAAGRGAKAKPKANAKAKDSAMKSTEKKRHKMAGKKKRDWPAWLLQALP